MQHLRPRAAWLWLCVAAALPLTAHSATKTATFRVEATIISDCTIGASGMNFNNVGTVTAVFNATSTLTITCTPMTSYTIGLDAGDVTGSVLTDRKMGNGAARLSFQLYRDAARTQVWGVTAPTDTIGGTGSGAAQTVTVYGQIPVQSTPAIGAYLNNVTATITY